MAGRTSAGEAGIELKDTPQALFRLLVLGTLLSARMDASAPAPPPWAATWLENEAGVRRQL